MFERDWAQVQDVPEVTETPTDSPTETKENVDEPSQEGEPEVDNTPDAEENIPFHKHPRWIAKQRELDEMRTRLAEFDTLKEEIGQLKQRSTPTEEPTMPDWWVEAFGSDEASKQAWLKQSAHEQKLMEQMEEKLLQRVRQSEIEEQKAQEDAVAKYEAQIENNLQTLRDKGLRFDKNELLKIVEEYSVDAEGNFTGILFPFDKAYEILQLKKSVPTATQKAREKAADLSVKNTRTGSKPSTVPSVTEVRQRGWGSWRDVI